MTEQREDQATPEAGKADSSNQEGEAQRLLSEFRAEVHKRQLSNVESYDKAVFSLATAFLGFSLAFLKDFIPFLQSHWRLLLPISWWFFGATILITICSLFSGLASLDKALVDAEDYYAGDTNALERPNTATKLTFLFNRISALLFALAIITTLLFVTRNLSERNMNQSNNLNKIISTGDLQRGISAPSIQKIPGNQPGPTSSTTTTTTTTTTTAPTTTTTTTTSTSS